MQEEGGRHSKNFTRDKLALLSRKNRSGYLPKNKIESGSMMRGKCYEHKMEKTVV